MRLLWIIDVQTRIPRAHPFTRFLARTPFSSTKALPTPPALDTKFERAAFNSSHPPRGRKARTALARKSASIRSWFRSNLPPDRDLISAGRGMRRPLKSPSAKPVANRPLA